MIENLVKAIVVLIAVGLIGWAADKWLPLEYPIKGLVLFLIVVVGVLVFLAAAGMISL